MVNAESPLFPFEKNKPQFEKENKKEQTESLFLNIKGDQRPT